MWRGFIWGVAATTLSLSTVFQFFGDRPAERRLVYVGADGEQRTEVAIMTRKECEARAIGAWIVNPRHEAKCVADGDAQEGGT